jgi:hypothetical protein
VRPILLLDDSEIRVLNAPAERGVFRFIEVTSHDRAVRLLTPYTLTSHGLHQLRTVVAEEGTTFDPFRLTDDQIIDEVAGRIVDQRVRIARDLRADELWFIAPEQPEEPPAQPAPPPRTRKLTWIELQFFDDRTGRPVNNLRVVLRTPDGNESFQTTDGDGLIRVDPVDPGSCDAWCEVKGATREDTLAYVGDGRPPKAADAGAGAPPSGAAIRHFARVERHKVKTGETLDGLAKPAKMTWQELAKFNWGTAVPDEINKRLRDEVGCTKKTKDGHNYVFDDTDKPGIVLIPAKWERDGLATGARHVFRGKALKRFFVILENDELLRIPETPWEATLADGGTVSGKLGLGGVDAIEDPPEGEVEVFFPDIDDIEAKSLAASARKAFDDRDPTEIHRLFRYPKETIRLAFEMYDKYFNTYRKGGLRADIKEEFSTDPDAERVFFGYFADLDAPPAPEETEVFTLEMD